MSFRNNKHARYISANIEIISGLKSLNITQDGENVDLVALVRTLMGRISALENADASAPAAKAATATKESALMGRISALESAAAASATTARAATTTRERLQGYMEKKLEKRLETIEKKTVTLVDASAATAKATTTTKERLQGYMEKNLEKRLETIEKKTVTLAELADVDVSDLTDGATLGYDATSQRWTPFVDEVSDDAVDDLADDLELITTD